MLDVLYQRCAGLTIRKQRITAAVNLTTPEGSDQYTERFELGEAGVAELSSWLSDLGVTHVAMEPTAFGWESVAKRLSRRFKVLIVDVHMFKRVPGRPKDINDAEWLVELLRVGLFKELPE